MNELLIKQFSEIIGAAHVLTAPDDTAPYYQDWRGRVTGHGLAVLRPNSTEQVATIVHICRQNGLAIVPQGGNTGLVGGSIPYADHPAIVLSLGRMNRLRDLDIIAGTMVVEAGCILANAQQSALEAGWELPIAMGSQGTSQIGGVLSTNAGGVLTIGFGNARERVLGLEVVLADGQIWSGLNHLRKNNTGYDLKQLFIGAEGTLGVITAASLLLSPTPAAFATALVAVADLPGALTLLRDLRRLSVGTLRAVEIMSARCLEFALRHIPGISNPISKPAPWFVLIESAVSIIDDHDLLQQALMTVLAKASLIDAVLCQTEAQRQNLWRLREGIVESQKFEGGSIKHDIALPVAQIPDFVPRVTTLVDQKIPWARPVIFGHLGDGNLHVNITQPVGANTADYLAQWDDLTGAVHALVVSMGGSFSAEHGIGRFKTMDMTRFKDPLSITLMQRLKHTLDPDTLFNPGAVVPPV